MSSSLPVLELAAPPKERLCNSCGKPVKHRGRAGLCSKCTDRLDAGLDSTVDPRAKLKAKRKATNFDLAWAAGFLEGEGHFGTAASKKCELVAASQVNSEPIGQLKEFFGGSVRLRLGTRKNESDIFIWQVTGARARGVMLTLFPLLSEKRRSTHLQLDQHSSK